MEGRGGRRAGRVAERGIGGEQAGGVAGVALSVWLFPWTDVVIAAFALAAGTWIGRAVPPRAQPMGILLTVLAALDSVQAFAASGGDTNPSAFRQWTMFLLVTPLGSSAIGFADLAVVGAIGEHWRRRGGNVVLSVLPGLVGLLLADALTLFVYRGGIPLLLFVLAGWLLAKVAAAAAASQRRRITATGTAGPDSTAALKAP